MRAAQYQAPCPTDDVAAGGLYPDAAPATPEYTVAPADAAAAEPETPAYPADAAAAEPETPAYPADYTGAPVDAAAGLYDTPTPCPSDEVLAAGGDEYVAPEQEAELPALDGGYPDALGAGAPCPETETPVEYDDDVADLGADLCTPHEDDPKWPPLRVSQAQVDRLESEIDAMNASIPPLKSFILPGGSPLSAYLHLCRTVCRRSERLVVELSADEAVNPAAIKYLNRLSDWFFVAARMANNAGRDDVLWVPGANRE